MDSPQPSAKLLVVHALVSLHVAPEFRQPLWVDEPEDAFLAIDPSDIGGVITGVLEKVKDELPQPGLTF